MDEEKILPTPENPIPAEMPPLPTDPALATPVEADDLALEQIPAQIPDLTIALPIIPREQIPEEPLPEDIPCEESPAEDILPDVIPDDGITPEEPIIEPVIAVEDTSALSLTEDEDHWLQDLLASTSAIDELQADELALDAAGLTNPADMELEQIIQETQAENWGVNEAIIEAQLLDTDDLFQHDPDLQSTSGTMDADELLEELLGDKSLTETEDAPAPELPQEEPVNTTPEKKPAPDPLEKGRPKRKEGYGLFGLPHLAATVVWLAIIVAIGVSIGRMAWLCASDVLALGREPITVTVTISETDDIDDVADKLKEAGLIRYPGLFKLYADITDAMEDIRPGTYTLNPPDAEEDQKNIVYDYMALVSVMSPHSPAQVVVSDLRIPEGYTCAQIFQLLEEKKVCTAAELETYVASLDAASLDYWFLEGVQWGDKYSLEGYLFPNTYDFYENDKPERVIRKLLDSFEANFTTVMKADLEALNDRLAEMYRKNGYGNSFIETHKYTIREVIIIASMIEKETANNLESFTVSSVIYNRLTDPNNYPFLNIDATLVYALGGKSDLTEEDLKIDHPYNTYTNPGLTPGAISNPSQNSIAAALDPSDTTFYFYAFDPSTGEHHFSSTYQEHLDFLASLKEDQ